MFCDNASAIKLSKNYVLHGRSKHIDVRFHFFCDLCKDGVIYVIYCKSEEQIADIMTKPFKTAVFEKLRSMLRVCSRKEVIMTVEIWLMKFPVVFFLNQFKFSLVSCVTIICECFNKN